jgi:hypothetical protein
VHPKFGSRVSVEKYRVDTKWVFYQTYSKQKKHTTQTQVALQFALFTANTAGSKIVCLCSKLELSNFT